MEDPLFSLRFKRPQSNKVGHSCNRTKIYYIFPPWTEIILLTYVLSVNRILHTFHPKSNNFSTSHRDRNWIWRVSSHKLCSWTLNLLAAQQLLLKVQNLNLVIVHRSQQSWHSISPCRTQHVGRGWCDYMNLKRRIIRIVEIRSKIICFIQTWPL